MNNNKDDEFIAKNLEISKIKQDILNELSNIRSAEIKEKEPLRKIQNDKKNKRMKNLGNYTFESIVRDMTAEMNEHDELIVMNECNS